MTDTTIATDIHQALDVELDFGTEVTFHLVLGADDFTNLTCLLVSPVLNFNVLVNSSLFQNLG